MFVRKTITIPNELAEFVDRRAAEIEFRGMCPVI